MWRSWPNLSLFTVHCLHSEVGLIFPGGVERSKLWRYYTPSSGQYHDLTGDTWSRGIVNTENQAGKRSQLLGQKHVLPRLPCSCVEAWVSLEKVDLKTHR